jgi:hypothetical protein
MTQPDDCSWGRVVGPRPPLGRASIACPFAEGQDQSLPGVGELPPAATRDMLAVLAHHQSRNTRLAGVLGADARNRTGDPSLRVAHLQGISSIYGLSFLVSAGWRRSELPSSGHSSGHVSAAPREVLRCKRSLRPAVTVGRALDRCGLAGPSSECERSAPTMRDRTRDASAIV